MIGFLGRTLDPELVKTHAPALILIWVLFILVPASFIMFMAFLWIGSFTIIDLRLGGRDALFLDIALSLAFFLQHSIMVRRGAKQRLAAFMPEHYHNAFYGLTSGIALLLAIIFWQKSPVLIAQAEGLMYWGLRGLFILSLAGFVWGVRSLGSFDSLGVKPLMRHISKRQAAPQPLTVRGPYRWVRHPLYLFMIVTIWSCPILTLDRLMFNLMWTVWIAIGTFLEDRDLHYEFGSRYREYSARVPMLIPYRIPEN